MLLVGGDDGTNAGGERVVEAEPHELPKSQGTVVPASKIALVQDYTHQLVVCRGEGNPMV